MPGLMGMPQTASMDRPTIPAGWLTLRPSTTADIHDTATGTCSGTR
jgi:hypothetical protein